MKRKVEDIRHLLECIFSSHGATPDEAGIFADVLIEAELRGRPTHGLNRAKGICRTLETRPPGRPEILEERGPLVRIDGADQSGYLVANLMVDHAVRVARAHGHALVGVRNTRHCGMLGYYAGRIALEGLVALTTADCGPMVAPWGAAEAILGTNPIAAAFPHKPYPVLIDMGTCAITYGAIDQARRTDRPLPPRSALDADGNFTTDPHRVRAILPFGGHRGSALALLVQLFSGLLVGAAAVPAGRTDYGIFLLAMKPDLFAPADHYEKELEHLIERIKSAAPLHPGTEILIPGERAFRERELRLRHGIELSPEMENELAALNRSGE